MPMGNSFKFDGLHGFSPVFKDVPVLPTTLILAGCVVHTFRLLGKLYWNYDINAEIKWPSPEYFYT